MPSPDSKRRLAVLIPTCSHSPGDVRIGYVLQALAMQPASPYLAGMDIFIRDEGPTPAVSDRWVQLTLELLVRKGHRPVYLRAGASQGVAQARREMLENLPTQYDWVLLVDDDLVPMPGAIEALLMAAADVAPFGFIQGCKIELDANRIYHNDINSVTACSEHSGPIRQWFGDAAFLLLNRDALRHVRWDVVCRFAAEGLPGEDVAITLMIAEHLACYGLAAAEAYHMSLATPRWRWEVPSDILQLESLRGIVSGETLKRALPHLGRYIDGQDSGHVWADGGADSKELL